MIKIFPEGEKHFNEGRIHRVWAIVYKDEEAYATYYAEWPILSEYVRQINIDIVLGVWGDRTTSLDRFLICVIYKNFPRPGFIIMNPDDRTKMHKALADHALSRDEVLKDPSLRDKIFVLLDEIYTQDQRINWSKENGNQ